MVLLDIGQTLLANGLPALGKLVAGKKGELYLTKIANFLGIKKSLLADKLQDPAILERLHELENNKLEILFKDKASARSMYIQRSYTFTDKLAKLTMWIDSIMLLILLGAYIGTTLLGKRLGIDTNVLMAVTSFISFVGGKLTEQLSQMYTFYFGASLTHNYLNKEKENVNL